MTAPVSNTAAPTPRKLQADGLLALLNALSASTSALPTCETSGASTASISTAMESVSKALLGSQISADAPLMEAGLDSLGAVEFRSQLSRQLGNVKLPETLIFDFPTLRQVGAHVRDVISSEVAPRVSSEALTGGTAMQQLLSQLVAAPVPSTASAARSAARISTADVPRANILAARLQLGGSVSDLASVWGSSAATQNSVATVPEGRWHVFAEGRVAYGACLHHIELFDHRAFGLAPAEAGIMDPHQRLALESSYSALHGAGFDRGDLMGSVTGVFAGIWASDYSVVLPRRGAAGHGPFAMNATGCSMLVGRLSYTLGLQGPSIPYDTACSSSLSASHAALCALQRLETDAALVLGVNVMCDVGLSKMFAASGMTSPTGKSYTFDSRADGYARGEACCCAVLELERADPSATCVRFEGGAVRHSGRSASLTAPNGIAQQALLRATLDCAGRAARGAFLLEAHGTGTTLGDPIEARASSAVRDEPQLMEVMGCKANVGHTEPAAGLTGMLKLSVAVLHAAASPNAQLHAMNPHVSAAMRDGKMSSLPVQLERMRAARDPFGGVSSFGLHGTIAHAVLALQLVPTPPLVPTALLGYRRRSFAWSDSNVAVEYASGADGTHTRMHSVCWAPLIRVDCVPIAPWILLSRATAHNDTASLLSWQSLVVLLPASATASSSLCGMRLALALAQRLANHKTVPSRVLVVTCGVHASVGGRAVSDAAHSGAWGFARVLRLEHTGLRTQTAEAAPSADIAPSLALSAPSQEAETAWRGTRCFVARLRPCVAASESNQARTRGLYVIMGGLGGLGMRSAALLVEGGASAVVLASRGGRVARDGQGLKAQLRSMSTEATVVACDSADATDASVMLSFSSLTGVLHAAGVLRDRILRSMVANDLDASFAPKALAASHVHSIMARPALDVFGLFSSVASTVGNVGQGNYAAANAYLDALASCCRFRGCFGSSLQIPAVSDAGMGATTFDAQQLDAMGAISLDAFAACLSISLAAALAATQRTQAPMSLALLQTIATTSFCEREQLGCVRNVTVVALGATASALSQLLAPLSSQQGRSRAELAVLRVVSELTGASSAAILTAETPLMEAGVDSLATTELAARLRALTGVALPPTLVFEQPTPRAIAGHLVAQLACNASVAVSSSRVCTGAPLALADSVGQRSGSGYSPAARSQPQAVCRDATGSVPWTRWLLDEAADSRVLISAQAARLVQGGFADARAFGVRPAEVGATDPQQRLALELGYASLHSASHRRETLLGGARGLCVGIKRPDWALAQPPSVRGLVYAVTGDHATGHPVSFASLGYHYRAFQWCKPPHPFAQYRAPSPESATTIVQASAASFIDLVDDHVVKGRVVFPGAGYLEMASTATSASDALPALRGVFFVEPLVLEAPSLLVKCTITDDRFEVRSCVTDTLEDAVLHCSGGLGACDGWQRVDHASVRCGVSRRSCSVGALYNGFDRVGLQYGPNYRTLIQSWDGGGGAAARLRARATREGTEVHPADLDDALCLSALSALGSGSEARLSFAVDEVLLQGASTELWTVRRLVKHSRTLPHHTTR